MKLFKLSIVTAGLLAVGFLFSGPAHAKRSTYRAPLKPALMSPPFFETPREPVIIIFDGGGCPPCHY
jgi:hypothetical protein